MLDLGFSAEAIRFTYLSFCELSRRLSLVANLSYESNFVGLSFSSVSLKLSVLMLAVHESFSSSELNFFYFLA